MRHQILVFPRRRKIYILNFVYFKDKHKVLIMKLCNKTGDGVMERISSEVNEYVIKVVCHYTASLAESPLLVFQIFYSFYQFHNFMGFFSKCTNKHLEKI